MASRDLADADPRLAEKVQRVMDRFNARHEGRKRLLITCTYRSPMEQRELWAIGRTLPGRRVTNLDGYIKRSLHNERPCRAVDLAVMTDADGPGPLKAQITWEDAPAYKEMGHMAEEEGLVWGGRWQLHDCPHVELPTVPVTAPGSDE